MADDIVARVRKGSGAVRLVVVGGGFTGAVLVIHLLRLTRLPLDIAVVEPSAELGRGVAYATRDPTHRINVPSDRMGLSPDDPDEATRWFFDHDVLPDGGSGDGQGHFYVPRHAYGSFMADVLRRDVAAHADRVRFRHVRGSVAALDGRDGDWSVRLTDGTVLAAEEVALCFGHAVPHLPFAMPDVVTQAPGFIPDPWAPDAFRAVKRDDAVLVVGTGLTMADVVVGLRRRGHRGPITAISRRGLLSRPHGRFVSDIDFLAGEAAPRTALGLLRMVRRRLREADPNLGWPPILDALRSSLPVTWAALPPGEKARALRRLLPFWDVHRFRIAPQVHGALADERAAGTLSVERAGLAGLAWQDERFCATLRRPGGDRDQRLFDAVVLCTGPEKDLRRNALVASLLETGIARLDETGLGLAVSPDSHVINRGGSAWRTLMALGPMTRGTFGEMTGAPDITRHVGQLVQAQFADRLAYAAGWPATPP